MKVVNLSRRRFVNERPVTRAAIYLWLLGAALLATNISSYSNYWVDSAEVRAELAAVNAEIDRAEASFGELDQRFANLDLEEMNVRATFLNQLIRDRVFPWSRLFDDLEEILPHDVKLTTVQPNLSEKSRQTPRRQTRRPRAAARRGSSSRAAPRPAEPPPAAGFEEVELTFQGYSKTDTAHFDLVDALYAHPSFREPDLSRESFVEATKLVNFDLSVIYLIGVAKGPDATGGEAPEGGTLAENQLQEGRTPEGRTPVGRTPEAEAPAAEAPRGEAEEESAALGESEGPAVDGEPGAPVRAPSPGADARDAETRAAETRAAEIRAAAARTAEARRRILPGSAAPAPGARDRAAAGEPRDPRPAATVGTIVTQPARPVTPRAIAPPARQPATRATAGRAAAPEGEDSDAEEDSPVRPRFVGPSASGTASVEGGGAR